MSGTITVLKASNFTTTPLLTLLPPTHLMTDSDEEPVQHQRRSSRAPSPSKKSQQYRESQAATAELRDKRKRKETIKKKRKASTNGPSKASQPRLPAIPETTSPIRGNDLPPNARPPNHGDSKGKGKAPTTPAATLSKGRRLVTPDAGSVDPAYPGPRPQPTGDLIYDGVTEEEWKRNLLIWYLACRDKRLIDPYSDYDNLKDILGEDRHWDSDDDELGNKLLKLNVDEEMGLYDDEPVARKPVQIQSLEMPVQPGASKLQGERVANTQTSTNLFKRKVINESEDSNKRTRTIVQGTSHPIGNPAEGLCTQAVRNPGVVSSTQHFQSSTQPSLFSSTITEPRPRLHQQVTEPRAQKQQLPARGPGNASNSGRSRNVSLNSNAGSVQPGVGSRSSSSSRRQNQSTQPRSRNTRDKERGDVTEEERSELEDDLADKADTGNSSKRNGGRGRLNQFEGVQRGILKHAGRAFYAIMATKGMYETDVDINDQRRLEAWNLGCEKYRVTIEDYPFAKAHLENLNDRLCTSRTHAKEIMEKAVEKAFFKEEMAPDDLKAHIEWLKAGGLHTKPNSEHGKGYFQHWILQESLNNIFFSHDRDIGVQFIDYFRVPSVELICYFCAIMQFLIEKREPGASRKKKLDFDTQRKAYLTHMDGHTVFLRKSAGRWSLTQKQLFLRAFRHSGSGRSALDDDMKSALREEDIQPDDPNEEEMAAWEVEAAELTADGGEMGGWAGLENEDGGQQPEESLAGEGEDEYQNEGHLAQGNAGYQDGAEYESEGALLGANGYQGEGHYRGEYYPGQEDYQEGNGQHQYAVSNDPQAVVHESSNPGRHHAQHRAFNDYAGFEPRVSLEGFARIEEVATQDGEFGEGYDDDGYEWEDGPGMNTMMSH